jgi:hypothetical protein
LQAAGLLLAHDPRPLHQLHHRLHQVGLLHEPNVAASNLDAALLRPLALHIEQSRERKLFLGSRLLWGWLYLDLKRLDKAFLTSRNITRLHVYSVKIKALFGLFWYQLWPYLQLVGPDKFSLARWPGTRLHAYGVQVKTLFRLFR